MLLMIVEKISLNFKWLPWYFLKNLSKYFLGNGFV